MKTYKVTVDKDVTRWYNEQGQFHREDGPAIEYSDGYKAYWVNNQRHREDGPAIEWADGYKQYWVNGKLHREDGPAIERANGDKQYWINGQRMSEQDFKNRAYHGKIVTIDGKQYKLQAL